MTKENTTEIVDSFKEAAPILRRPFTPEAVRFKVQSGTVENALVVAYIDARLVAERLNMVCPHLWYDAYEPTSKGMVCRLTIDGITRSDYGDGYVGKGLFSDAFKRAAVKFGVGVSLYSIPSTWLNGSPHVKANNKGKPEITTQGMAFLRGRYKSWLTDVGIAAFGEPLDHGDTEESAGDVEALVTPADVAAEGDPTDEQREELREQVKRTGIKGEDKELLFAKFGVQAAASPTFKQVEKLIEELKSMEPVK